MSAAAVSPQMNPFPGLRPFREDEDHLFFGRENQVDAMVNKLAETRFLAVVGTSGSGKSSLVNCGLRPALRQGLMARAGTAWRMAQFRPGNDPIGAMARALAEDGVLFREHALEGLTLAEIVETTLRMSKLGLIDIWEQAALGEGVNLLVVVDQFEELIRYRQLGTAARGEDAAAFVNLVLEVKERANCRIYVVLTMRSDFLGDCTQFPGLAEAINAGQYLVPRMTRDERRAAIEGPIGVGGAEISPVLLTRLVNDVGDNPDQLSILQHALNRTWALWQEQGGKGPLDLPHYEAIGTMAHALDQHAEQAHAELGTTRHQQICERLFKALTDKATDPRGVRRPTTLGELCALTDASVAEVADVIAVFRDPSRSFLMPPAGEALKAESVIDISHESLMRVWQRLIKWADEEAQSAQTYRRLADAAELHAAGSASLWRDPELQLALDWRGKNRPNEAWAARYHPGFATAMRFLTESSEARDAERAERERQRQREREAEREKADAQARYARLMGWAALVSGALFLVALGGGAWAYWASRIAEAKEAEAQAYLKNAQITQSLSLVNAAEQDPSDQSTRILLALEALPDAGEKIERPFVFEAQRSLIDGLNDLRELTVVGRHTDAINGIAATPDGTRVVTGSEDSTARVWDAQTGAKLLQLEGHKGAIRAIAVTPDGTRIITSSEDKTARVWDAWTGAEMLQLKGHTGPVRGVAVTPDGTRIITGSGDNTARVWDAQTGVELLQLKGHTDAVLDVAVTPDKARIITGSGDNTARVWDAQTGVELLQLKGHTDSVFAVAVTPDGTRIITGSGDDTARVWDAQTVEIAVQLLELKGHTDAVLDVAVTPDGTRIVTSSADNTTRVWDTHTGAELLRLKGHTDLVRGVAVMSDGGRIVTGSADQTARMWDARTETELLQLNGHTGAVRGAMVTPDGARIVTGSEDETARVWDAWTGAEMLQLKGHTGPVRGVAVTPDGARVVTGSEDKTARIWDSQTGAESLQLKGHTDAVFAVAVTPDGTRVITGSGDNTARLWDAKTGVELLQLKGHTDAVLDVAVTADGTRIITGSGDKTARVWDAQTGGELLQLKGHAGAVGGVAVTPDGTRLITGSADKTARVWDAQTGGELLQLKGHTRAIRGVAVTANGARVLTASSDNTARVWDAQSGTELLRIKGHTDAVNSIAATPDKARVITASQDATSRLWDLAQLRPPPVQQEISTPQVRQALIEQAKAVVPRCLTIDQRGSFLLPPKPPGWCIDMSKYPYDTEQWKDWKAGKTMHAIDSTTAKAYGQFADAALKAGNDFRVALEAAELGITFDPEQTWITMNRAHALMFLGRTQDARKEYLAHRGMIREGQWEKLVVDDFQALRGRGHEHSLMIEIERLFKPSLPVEAGE
jgi:WD40 repeat protein/energy-coupling factor transporter ATP-binding protein EcfA2